ncbi:hypothetical protein NVV94_08470 [Pseudomonas sp. LS1212]|uniref:hypothetical protein n=1 Tax=Pseudomonas sp. LS1212 TaxID=2972478 RepID=UPI00215C16D4|nr:hypothetical protein [Pseudomonas sp. LS1212]UVJ45576.1 hypothetical protein NVV94_08470 [Pseudomonas sp. LS1212]
MQQQTGELERRLRLLENPAEQGEDFDGMSWFWLLLLGVVLPIVALVAGWNL